jgi:hypothetical protein
MSPKRNILFIFFAATVIMIGMVVLRHLIESSDKQRFSRDLSRSSTAETGQNLVSPNVGSDPVPLAPPQGHSDISGTTIAKGNFQLLPSASGPIIDSANAAAKDTDDNEKDAYFDLMTAFLAEDFPELELSKREQIKLFDLIWQFRDSFERTRSLNRSADNAELLHQLELERDAAIEAFENIVGMSFQEFMLRTPATEGGIDQP